MHRKASVAESPRAVDPRLKFSMDPSRISHLPVVLDHSYGHLPECKQTPAWKYFHFSPRIAVLTLVTPCYIRLDRIKLHPFTTSNSGSRRSESLCSDTATVITTSADPYEHINKGSWTNTGLIPGLLVKGGLVCHMDILYTMR